MMLKHPQLPGYTKDKTDSVVNCLLSKGFTKDAVIKIGNSLPGIFSLSTDAISNKLNFLLGLNYSKDDVISMIYQQGKIFSYDVETMYQRMKNVENHGYSFEQVKEMFRINPALYGCSMSSISDKIKLYESLGLKDIIFNKPENLRQSVKKSYSRYMYLKNEGQVIVENNYKDIFLPTRDFVKKYKADDELLQKRYDCKEYMEKLNGRVK